MDGGLAGKQARTHRRIARLRTGCLAVLAIGLAGCSGLLAVTVMADEPLRPIIVGGLFAGVFGLAALTSFLYESADE